MVPISAIRTEAYRSSSQEEESKARPDNTVNVVQSQPSLDDDTHGDGVDATTPRPGADAATPFSPHAQVIANSHKNSVMISYCRRNAEAVKRIHDAFVAQGVDVWIDYEDIPKGVDWWESIKSGIEHANVCVFCLSAESLKSKVCGWELDHMAKHSKRIVPIVVADDFDWDDVRPEIAKLNFIFFCRESDDFNTSFNELCEAIVTDHKYVETHTKFNVRAQEWDSAQRTKDLLLRAGVLRQVDEFLEKAVEAQPPPSVVMEDYFMASHEEALKEERRQALVDSLLLVEDEDAYVTDGVGETRRGSITGRPHGSSRCQRCRFHLATTLNRKVVQLLVLTLILVSVCFGLVALSTEVLQPPTTPSRQAPPCKNDTALALKKLARAGDPNVADDDDPLPPPPDEDTDDPLPPPPPPAAASSLTPTGSRRRVVAEEGGDASHNLRGLISDEYEDDYGDDGDVYVDFDYYHWEDEWQEHHGTFSETKSYVLPVTTSLLMVNLLEIMLQFIAIGPRRFCMHIGFVVDVIVVVVAQGVELADIVPEGIPQLLMLLRLWRMVRLINIEVARERLVQRGLRADLLNKSLEVRQLRRVVNSLRNSDAALTHQISLLKRQIPGSSRALSSTNYVSGRFGLSPPGGVSPVDALAAEEQRFYQHMQEVGGARAQARAGAAS